MRGLYLEPAAPRGRPRTARRAPCHHAFVPGASASSRKRSASSGVAVRRAARGSRAARRVSSDREPLGGGRSRRSSPSTCRQSKKNAVSGSCLARRRRRFRFRSAHRPWNGAAVRRRAARAPRRRGRALAGKRATASTTSGTRSVTSSSPRVDADLVAGLCTWMRAPSSFHSKAAGRSRASASPTSVRRLREHRLERPEQLEAEAVERARRRRAPPPRPSQVAAQHDRAAHPPRDAGRLATASTITPSSAPCRSSPSSSDAGSAARSPSRARTAAASSVSRERLRSRSRRPTRSGRSRASTSRSSSVGSGAGEGSDRAAPPTPLRPSPAAARRRGRRPRSGTSSGRSARRESAINAVFRLRADVPATSSDVRAISSSSIAAIQAAGRRRRIRRRRDRAVAEARPRARAGGASAPARRHSRRARRPRRPGGTGRRAGAGSAP